jgi:hypothetical protein
MPPRMPPGLAMQSVLRVPMYRERYTVDLAVNAHALSVTVLEGDRIVWCENWMEGELRTVSAAAHRSMRGALLPTPPGCRWVVRIFVANGMNTPEFRVSYMDGADYFSMGLPDLDALPFAIPGITWTRPVVSFIDVVEG